MSTGIEQNDFNGVDVNIVGPKYFVSTAEIAAFIRTVLHSDLRNMPRIRIRTTNNRSYSTELMKQAVQSVLGEGRSVRSVAMELNLPRITLKRYVDRSRGQDINNVNFRPKNEHLMVFSQDEELLLKKYLQHACNIHYGLSRKQACILAYEYAVANRKNVIESWCRDSMAGKEWIVSFMRRHKYSLRTPEQTSMSRATSFNKTNVDAFYKNLLEVKTKYSLQSEDIYNLDESGATTVHKPPKILATTGQRSVGQITSAERGTLITLVGIIGATGRYVPPFLIFPRVHFKDNMLHGTPLGTKGAATPSAWMNSSLFLPVLQHFVQHERPSKEHPKLIILDNHESHLSIAALQYAKDNGIILLTLPPHCSHKLQPLDVAVFGPFKKFYNVACDRWMVNHPGKVITIYDAGGLIGEAFLQSFTPKIICSGFRATGIEPFNAEIFPEESFLSSYVTDRPNPEQNLILEPLREELPSTSQTTLITPEQIRPYPKASPRKFTTKRKKGKSLILTSTPIKEGLEEEARMREEKLNNNAKVKETKKKVVKKRVFESSSHTNTAIKEGLEEEARMREEKLNNNVKVKETKKKLVKKRVFESSSSSSDENVSYQESSDSPEDFDESNENSLEVSKGMFIIVKVYGKVVTNFRHYVAKVCEELLNGYNVSFLKRYNSTSRFTEEDEFGFVSKDDIIHKLPPPIKSSSARFANMTSFPFDFGELDFTVF